MEQLKILEIINRWGYLNKEELSLLLNKEMEAINSLLKYLVSKKLIRIDKLTRKNYYMLSSLGNQKLGQGNKKIKINYNELAHQNLLIKWLCQETDIISYQTEKELKSENPREKEKKIAKEFKTIKNKWVKNWEFLVWEDKQIGLSTCLDEELNDTYKLRSSYENKNHFCDEENCRNQWRHFVKFESLDSFFHLCDYHVKKFGDKMFNILQTVKKENGNKSIFDN